MGAPQNRGDPRKSALGRHSPDCPTLSLSFRPIEACCNEIRLATDCARSQIAGLAASNSSPTYRRMDEAPWLRWLGSNNTRHMMTRSTNVLRELTVRPSNDPAQIFRR